MIRAIIYRKDGKICGVELTGHAEYAKSGRDIVCSAVSVLTLNTINAIEQFTEIPFRCEADEKNGGFFKVLFPLEGMADHDTQLLLQTLEMGLSAIETEYKRYFTLIDKEV
ncbi:ribosomal-processing cysteine protease Prp [Anaerotignum propionicum]|uniref:ribosomal-processing cysteine protease Prp n=1 Tax=Anaerotignum propionicum TaxID=28446 RepID=UPI00210C654E|nr:ribosomal-processing cysteine protease Prp [Anaerotignum propionicum]MCQ4937037.1 ribosomal-processing cysteine protease Prp [Anaerotignum propionicum]